MAFNPKDFIEESISSLIKLDGTAILAASGGVDSTVCAVLAHKALGSRFKAVFVDTGVLRKGEVGQVKENFKQLGIALVTVDASKEFFAGLKGIVHPEKKRKKIGELFIKVFEHEAKELKAKYLIQGTIAPDWIESGSGIRDTIKTHHNVGGLPKKMGLKVVEPIRDLYKDEVRAIAKELKMQKDPEWRQPFPGPGLAVRVIGEVTREKAALCREANAIVTEEIYSAFQLKEIDSLPWQYFAVLLDTKTTGVQGDVRAYGYTVAIRAIESTDAMTAQYFKIPHAILHRISLRITNGLKQINRVVYDITDKPPATIEWL
ncbi:TPA: glutamine-hydrolyzing GMP synthase subunit GuaA [Candidatus Micrarchaeota archaeon]|nr:glutamine-hydrolyzing GMP synthase subunit GuaA [Candidatus Micrarchaeota archaeon]